MGLLIVTDKVEELRIQLEKEITELSKAYKELCHCGIPAKTLSELMVKLPSYKALIASAEKSVDYTQLIKDVSIDHKAGTIKATITLPWSIRNIDVGEDFEL